jgi:hypothetical protein
MTFTPEEKYINVLIGSFINKLWNPDSDGHGLMYAINLEENETLKIKLNNLYNLVIQNNMDEYYKIYNDCRDQNKHIFDYHLKYVLFGIYKNAVISTYIKKYVSTHLEYVLFGIGIEKNSVSSTYIKKYASKHFDFFDEYLQYVNKMSRKNDSYLIFIKNEFIPKYTNNNSTNNNYNINISITDELFSSTPIDKNKYNKISYIELNQQLDELNERNTILAMNKEIYSNNSMKEEFINNIQTSIYIENRINYLDALKSSDAPDLD